MSLRTNNKKKVDNNNKNNYNNNNVNNKKEKKELKVQDVGSSKDNGENEYQSEEIDEFWKQILSSLFEYDYISGIVVFDIQGLVITSKNINTKSFPKDGINLHKYFEKTPLGQYLNKQIVSDCGYDLLGPGYQVEGVSKHSIYGFNPSTKFGFSLEKTKTTFILGTFNDKQDKFDAFAAVGGLASDLRIINL